MRYCSKCGNKMSDDQLYCPKCGNKEPFIKNDKQSSWKDFDVNDKAAVNVNYDFKTVAPSTTNPMSVKNKPLRVFGIAFRIYSIVIATFFIISSALLTFANVFSTKGRDTVGFVAIALAGVQIISIVVITVLMVKSKNWNVVLKSAFQSAVTLSVFTVGFAIGQFFLSRRVGFAPFGIFTGAMSFMQCAMLAKPFSFKKAAK